MTINFKITSVAAPLLAALLLASCNGPGSNIEPAEEGDPPEVALGERLFLETRFAQDFAVHSGGDVNRPLAVGDPVMDETVTLGEPRPARLPAAR